MGKASRKKQERKVNTVIENVKIFGSPIEQCSVKLCRAVYLDVICESIALDDLEGMFKEIDLFEAKLGESIFDAEIFCDSPGGSMTSTNIIFFAAAVHACECTIGLLRLASNRKHAAAPRFVAFTMRMMQQLPPSDEGHQTMVRVIEAYMEPVDIIDARNIFTSAHNPSVPPVMSELIRRVSLRYIAKQEQDDLREEIGLTDRPSRASLRM